MGEFSNWVSDQIKNPDIFRIAANDPEHLLIVPISKSPLFNPDRAQFALDWFRKKRSISEENGRVYWVGDKEISYAGRSIPIQKLIYAFVSKVGIPEGFSMVTVSDDPNDISFDKMYLVRHPIARGVGIKKGVNPFGYTSRINVFGDKSAREIYDGMMEFSSESSIERWKQLLSMTIRMDKSGVKPKYEQCMVPTDAAFTANMKGRVAKAGFKVDQELSDPSLLCHMSISKELNMHVRYHNVRFNNEIVKLHHFLYSLIRVSDPINFNTHNLSICENPWCVNPLHYEVVKK